MRIKKLIRNHKRLFNAMFDTFVPTIANELSIGNEVTISEEHYLVSKLYQKNPTYYRISKDWVEYLFERLKKEGVKYHYYPDFYESDDNPMESWIIEPIKK